MKPYRFLLLIFLLISIPGLSLWPEDLALLYTQGNAAMMNLDYATAGYNFRRMMDAGEWAAFPEKTAVLGKMGLIEESHARYPEAAYYYQLLVDDLSKSQNKTINAPTSGLAIPLNSAIASPLQNNPARTLNNYYIQRLADCYDRAGNYQKSNTLYWSLLKNAEKSIEPAYLLPLMKTYDFLEISPEEIKTLHNLIIPAYVERLGWSLADLYRIKEKNAEAREIYELLWQKYPQQASAHASSMYTVYKASNQLEKLLSRIQAAEEEEENFADDYLLLEAELLENNAQPQQALTAIETFLSDGDPASLAEKTKTLIGKFSTPVLDKWIDLLEKIRGTDAVLPVLQSFVMQSPLETSRREKLANLLMNAGRKSEALALWKDWLKLQANNPLATLQAVENIFVMGDVQSAKELLAKSLKTVAPNLAYNYAITAFKLGDFSTAIASFTIASTANGMDSNQIVSFIDQYTDRSIDTKEFVSAMIQSVSPMIANQKEPAWLRESLLSLGLKTNQKDKLDTLAAADPSGRWKMLLALEAVKQGKTNYAVEWLQSIPQTSIYAPGAELQLAVLLGKSQDPANLHKALELYKPYMDKILQATEAIRLTDGTLNRLMDYMDVCLNCFQPGEAISAIRYIESASPGLTQPMSPTTLERLRFGRAQALTELSSLEPALELLKDCKDQPFFSKAVLLRIKILITQKKTDEALSALKDMIKEPAHWQTANQALALYMMLEPLVGESLRQYSDAVLYQLQGRFEDAIPLLRQIAVDNYGEDTEEWARYAIGALEKQAGFLEKAKEEWKRLNMDADNPVVHGLLRYELFHLATTPAEPVRESTEYQELLLDFPNTLFSDLARLEVNENGNKLKNN